MATFIINTKAELWKCRKTAAYWITILAGIFIPFTFWLMLVFKSDHFGNILKNDPWHYLLRNCWQPMAAFLMPCYVILVTSLVVQVEYRNNTWKQVYASPRSYADIFFSKFLVVQGLILTAIVLFNLAILVAGYSVNTVLGVYTFFSHPVPWTDMLTVSSKMYVAILAMTSIQYWISLRFKNFIAPIGIGLGLLITGLMIIQWDKIIYYPYAYTALTYFKDLNKGRLVHLNYSWIWFVGIILLAFWDTVKRKERG
ncbi:ABC transporter permease subunit [Pseudoflavitalea sp. X16]|uniref:ABC transporter permease n=1 Tax=Paraflavitalea devenefica TaxID=2716334 RepID=UPI00141E1C59|nr:ABC transporter permease [Paraflavitalea devenefica]NII27136.1 ABC transporter permease subunit [Paraflavitalea devenefica]